MNWERSFFRWTARQDGMRSGKTYRRTLAAALFFFGAGAAGNFVSADVTVKDAAYASKVTKNGNVYEISNQLQQGNKALNTFTDFFIGEAEIANLRLGTADHLINVVDNKINIDGVVNAFKNGKIAGDVYFFSDKGIAVGKTGVINVGSLTLGANASTGQSIFTSGYSGTAADRAQFLTTTNLKDGAITVKGKINTTGRDVVLVTGGAIELDGAEIRTAVDFNTPGENWTAADYRNSFVNLSSAVNAKAAVLSTDGVVLLSQDDVTVTGSRIDSAGADIHVLSNPQKGDSQAKKESPENGGVIVIKNSTLDSSSASQDSGDISIESVRTAMGVTKVEVKGSTVNAGGTAGHSAGDVSINADTQTKLLSWDIGDGAYAVVRMGADENGTGNTITGDNVSISAKASTTGSVVGETELTEEEITAGLKNAEEDNSFISAFTDKLQDYAHLNLNLRAVASMTKIKADAEVTIEKTDMAAVGGTKGDTAAKKAEHGNLSVGSYTASAIETETKGLANFGFTVGISDASAVTNIKSGTLYAEKDAKIAAEVENTVSLDMYEYGFASIKLPLEVNLTWAELSSKADAEIGSGATLTTGGKAAVEAESVRKLVSTVGNGSSKDVVAAAAAVAISDTSATAKLDGKVYADGEVEVSATNETEKGSSSTSVYEADTVSALTSSGKGYYENIEKFLDPEMYGLDKLNEMFLEKIGAEEGALFKNISSKFGLNAATALLFGKNSAEASVGGTVRGLAEAKDAAGRYVGSTAAGAASLSVTAETVTRTSVRGGAYQSSYEEEGEEGQEETKNKSVGIAATVNYAKQQDTAKAYVTGDVKTEKKADDTSGEAGAVTIKAETKRPWQTALQDYNSSEAILEHIFAIAEDRDAYLTELVDSWSHSSSNGEKVSGAASIGIMEYKNTAEAYIGEGASVEVAGNLEVEAENEVKTVNFSGDIRNPVSETPASPHFWKNFKTSIDNPLGTDTANAVGGAALAVHQDNTAKAYIADGAKKAEAEGELTVSAENDTLNVALEVAGGKADSVAFDATVGVNRFGNTTTAYIGDAEEVSGESVSVTAEDKALDINLAGAVGASAGTAGIGASIAYNHIARDTSAYITGSVTSAGNIDIKAENTGKIIAASVAGAVAYTGTNATESGAGSSGFHASDGSTDSMENSVNTLLGASDASSGSRNIEYGRENVTADDGFAALQNVAASDSSLSESVGVVANERKNTSSFAISANISVNRVTETAKAYAAKAAGASGAPLITAGTLRISSENSSAIYAVNGAISANTATTSKANASIAGSFMYNSITGADDAYADGVTLVLSGNEEKDSDGKDIDESLTVSAENNERILNVAVSGSGATRGYSVAGQISVNRIDDTNRAYVKDSTVRAAEAVKISAVNGADLDSYTGAVSASMGGTGVAVGASVGVNLSDGVTKATLENSEVTGLVTESAAARGGSLSVTAADESDSVSVVASGTLAGDFGAAFSASGNRITSKTDAHIDTAKEILAGGVTVSARNGAKTTVGVGQLAIGNSAAGASIGVMVNTSDADAYIKGDAAKAKTIGASSISVRAENVYGQTAETDGSSEKTTAEEIAKGKTVAVGAEGGAAQFAGSGSVTVNVIKQNTDAYLGAGKYDADNGSVEITAESAAHLFGLAGGLSVSGGTGVGAAVDTQVYTGHTYAYMGDGASLSKAGSVTISSVASEKLTSVAATLAGGGDFAGAGAAGAHKISTDTKAFLGNEEDKDGTGAAISGAGAVTVSASDTTELSTGAGSGAIGGEMAGIGLSAAVEVVDKKVEAFVGNHASVAGSSLAVTAKNISDSTTAAAGLGAGGSGGVAGSGSETVATHVTKAYVGKSASVSVTGAADVKAESAFTQGAGAGSVGAAGDIGAGIALTCVTLDATTLSYADDAAKISAGNKISISASHKADITYATIAGGDSGTVGIDGAVGVNVLTDTTKAYAGESAELSADGADGISLTATDTTKLHGGTGGEAVGAGAAGVGAAVTVNSVTKDTEAYAGKAAKLDSRGKIALAATNKENLYNLSLQGSGGLGAGVAGAVTVTNLSAVTKAFTDSAVQINQKENYKAGGGAVSVSALHDVEKLTSTVVGAALGSAGVSAAVDVANVTGQTNAYLGNGNLLDTAGQLTVSAEEKLGSDKENITSTAAAGSGGLGAVAGSVSVYNFASGMAEDDKKTLTADFDSWLKEKITSSQTSDALSAYGETASGIKSSLDSGRAAIKNAGTSAPSTADEKGTAAKIGDSSQISAAGVSVSAKDSLYMKERVGNGAAGSGLAAGISVASVNSGTEVTAMVDKGAQIAAADAVSVAAAADHRLDAGVYGASVSWTGIAAEGTGLGWKDTSTVLANIERGTSVTGGSLSVSATNSRTLSAKTVGASVALIGAAAGSVIKADVSGGAKAILGEEKKDEAGAGITADVTGALSVTAETETELTAAATAPAAGVFSGAGAGVYLTSNADAETLLRTGTKLAAKNISVGASATPKLNAQAVGVGAGIASVGATVAHITEEDDAEVKAGTDVTLTAGTKKSDGSREKDGAISVTAETKKAKSGTSEDYNAYARVIAGAGGVLSGAVTSAKTTLTQETLVTLGANAKLTGGSVTLTATHADLTNQRGESVAAAGVSGTGSEAETTITSIVKVDVGSGSAISTAGTITAKADNESRKTWKSGDGDDKTKNAYSGGASLATGNGVVNTNRITHTTKVTLGSGSSLSAYEASLTEKEAKAGKTVSDKNAIALDAHSNIVSKDYLVIGTGTAVGAAHIKNTNTATADTKVDLGGATLIAGDTATANGTITENVSATYGQSVKNATSIGGGSIFAASRNDADISSTTLVDVFGAAGYAGGENDVTYKGTADTVTGKNAKLETAYGDIRLAAGRDSDGEAGTIKTNAESHILNSTAIPISTVKDPTASTTSAVNVKVEEGASLLSDRNVYLQSRAEEDEVTAEASGEIKDWAHAVGEIFGASSTKGKKSKTLLAEVVVDGTVETGTHRNQSITIGGSENASTGKWSTTITRTGGVSYTYKTVTSGEEKLKRLEELETLREKYASDPVARAAYDAEIALLEQELVDNGIGIWQKDASGNKHFVKLEVEQSSDYADAKEELAEYLESGGTVSQNISKVTDAQELLQKQTEALEEIETKYTSFTTAYEEYETAKSSYEYWVDWYAKVEKGEAGPSDYYDREIYKYLVLTNHINPAKDEMESKETAAKTKWNTLVTSLAAYDETYKTSYAGSYVADTIDTVSMAASMEVVTSYYNDSSTRLANLRASDVDGVHDYYSDLKASVDATANFLTNVLNTKKGTENDDGSFTYTGSLGSLTYNETDGSYTWAYTENGENKSGILLHTKAYGLQVGEVTLDDLDARLGAVIAEGKNFTGSGTVKAHTDATISVTNASPDNLVTGSVTISSGHTETGTVTSGETTTSFTKTYGGAFSWNGQSITTEAQLKNKNENSAKATPTLSLSDGGGSSISIQSTFRPAGTKQAAPSLTLGKTGAGNVISAVSGSVTIASSYGDVNNRASVRGKTVSVTADNGDYTQSYDAGASSGRITNVGGDISAGSLDPGTSSAGILANGNVFISARYVNINGAIQSGIADWTLVIPENPTFSYTDTAGTKHTGMTLDAIDKLSETERAAGTFTLENGTGNAAKYLTYDAVNARFVLGGLETHGGTVEIVGTIMNTSASGAGKITALDGYGTVNVTNNAARTLELTDIDTGSGAEGKIILVDLDKKSGEKLRTTTYTRVNGVTSVSVTDAAGNDITNGASASVYKPADDLYYIWQTGRDSSVVTDYKETHKTFNIFGDWGDVEKLKREATAINITYYEGYDITPNGTFVGGAAEAKRTAGASGYDKSSTEYQTSESDAYDVETKTKRLWYSLGTVKQYTTTFKIKTGKTTITTHSVNANNGIAIGFSGTETGGTVKVNGGAQDVLVSGTVHNAGGSAGGTTSISGASIAGGTNGFLSTDTLTLAASKGDVGTFTTMDGVTKVSSALRTNASKLSGSAAGSFAVTVEDGGTELGAVTAGGLLFAAAADDLTQTAGTALSAKRIELSAGGGIAGAFDAEKNPSRALVVQLAQPGEDAALSNYGLKAEAEGGAISIRNTGGDLYLDSVISETGSVTLETNGKILDNNTTDTENESVIAKLEAWAKAGILEDGVATGDAKETTAKQKDLLQAAVEKKYNRYQALKQNMKDGEYVLSDTEKVTLAVLGVTDIEAYAEECAAEYKTLEAAGVGSWTWEAVSGASGTAYADSLDATVYADASLKAGDSRLADDAYLTREEKENILVGSAKSAAQLLFGYSEGAIRDGVTDTNITRKETPHVKGTSVSLFSTGTAGGIGSRTETVTVDLSKNGWWKTLKTADRLALYAAEYGDFKYDAATGILSAQTVKSIDAETAGTLSAVTETGSVYLMSEGGLTLGTVKTGTKKASGNPGDADADNGDELRIKAEGNLTGTSALTVGGHVVLEAGSGSISGITLSAADTGILTARAAGDISISKAGDLTINTLYSSDGNLTLALSGHDLFADDLHEKNMKAHRITVTDVKNFGREEGEMDAVGIEVTDKKDADGNVTEAGKLTVSAAENADLVLYGDTTDADVSAAGRLTLTNKGNISGGAFTAGTALTLTNTVFGADDATEIISAGTSGLQAVHGGTFSGKTVAVTNGSDLAGGTFTAAEGLTLLNTSAAIGGDEGNRSRGVVRGGTFAGKTAAVTNAADLTGASVTATGALTLKNLADAAITGSAEEISFTGATADLTNAGTIRSGYYTAAEGALTYTDTADAKLGAVEENEKIVFMSQNGNITAESLKGTFAADEVSAKENVKISGTRTVSVASLTAGVSDITASGDGSDIILTTASVMGVHKASAARDVKFGTVTAGRADFTAGNDIIGKTLEISELASLTAKNTVTISETLKTGGDANVTATKGDAKISASEIGGKYMVKAGKDAALETVTAKSAEVEAGENITAKNFTTLEGAKFTAGDSVTISETLKTGGDTNVTATKGDAKISASEIGGKYTVKAGNDAAFETVTAKSAEMEAGENITAENFTTLEGAKFTAGDSVTISETLKTGGDANVTATKGDAKISASEIGGKYTVKAGNDAALETVITKAAEVEAERNISAQILRATAGDMKLTAGHDITAGAIASAENVIVSAGGAFMAEHVRANKNASLASIGVLEIKDTLAAESAVLAVSDAEGDVVLNQADIAGEFSVVAGRDIRFGLSEAVSQSITVGELSLTAGRDVTLTTEDRVRKLLGVNLSAKAAPVSGTGEAGSLLNADGRMQTFDSAQRGVGSVTSTAGKISVAAGGTVQVDCVSFKGEGGSLLTVAAANLGIDSLAGEGTVTAKITGAEDYSHYAGLHAETPVTLEGSRIETLDFTGRDGISLSNTSLSGDSYIATEQMTFQMKKNPRASLSEYFGWLSLYGLNIGVSKQFTDARDGITINGMRFPDTADSVLYRSLYDTAAGRDERKKEEGESVGENVEIRFREAHGTENHIVIER